jgi:hypothetical protein
LTIDVEQAIGQMALCPSSLSEKVGAQTSLGEEAAAGLGGDGQSDIDEGGVVKIGDAIDGLGRGEAIAGDLPTFCGEPMDARATMLEALAFEIAIVHQHAEASPRGVVARVHPCGGLLERDEAMAIDPLEHLAVAGGQSHGAFLLSPMPCSSRHLSGPNYCTRL